MPAAMKSKVGCLAKQDGPNKDEIALLEMEHWLPYNFSVLANRVSACLFEMYNQQYGLSVSGWRVMAVLGAHQPLSAKDVAQLTAMDQVKVTRAINQMDSLSLITRNVDENDRRKIVLQLSEKGEVARAQIVPLARALERAMICELNGHERATLDKIMTKLMSSSESLFMNPSDWPVILREYGDGQQGSVD